MKTETENRLVVEIAKGLQSVVIRYGTTIVPGSIKWALEIAKWLPEDVARKCARFCGGSGFGTFISNEITRRLTYAARFDSKAAEKKLTSMPEFRDTVTAAHEIVRVLANMPYRYRVSVGLPISFSKPIIATVGTFALSDTVQICTSDNLPTPFPLTSENENFETTLWDDLFTSSGYETALNSDRLYFTSTALGYSGSTGTSLMARELEDNLRAFYGASLALKMLGADWLSEVDEPPIIVHREDAPGRMVLAFKELESDLWSNKNSLSTKRMDGSKPNTDIKVALNKVSQIFRDETAPKRLFTACIWFFRATFSKRPLDKLLEATIAIEVILGDRETADGIGLTKLLGNRCAYMLGQSSSERDAIQQTFNELYKLRSSIVHSGKHRADQKETKVVNDATVLCGRIIAHEINALTREAAKPAE